MALLDDFRMKTARDAGDFTIRGIIDQLGGSRSIAQACDVQTHSVRSWAYNGSIPRKHHRVLLQLAGDQGIDLTRTQLFMASWDQEGV